MHCCAFGLTSFALEPERQSTAVLPCSGLISSGIHYAYGVAVADEQERKTAWITVTEEMQVT